MTSMRFRLALPIALLALALLAPSGAQAASRYKVGIGDQSVSVFGDPLFQALKLKRIRYIVPWNWNADATQEAEVRGYLTAARAARFEPFVTFTAARGCWTGAVYRRTKACRAPSASAYTKRFKAFRRAFPTVKVFSAWNEANHKSQPVYKSPRKAAQYYNAMRKACRSCTIVALDLLDSSNMSRYFQSFKRSAKGNPKIWGLHNYGDANGLKVRSTPRLLAITRGKIWFTETGGVVLRRDYRGRKVLRTYRYSLRHAAASTKHALKLSCLSPRITRIYLYHWQPPWKVTNWDSGLVDRRGRPRPAFTVVRKWLSRAARASRRGGRRALCR